MQILTVAADHYRVRAQCFDAIHAVRERHFLRARAVCVAHRKHLRVQVRCARPQPAPAP